MAQGAESRKKIEIAAKKQIAGPKFPGFTGSFAFIALTAVFYCTAFHDPLLSLISGLIGASVLCRLP